MGRESCAPLWGDRQVIDHLLNPTKAWILFWVFHPSTATSNPPYAIFFMSVGDEKSLASAYFTFISSITFLFTSSRCCLELKTIKENQMFSSLVAPAISAKARDFSSPISCCLRSSPRHS